MRKITKHQMAIGLGGIFIAGIMSGCTNGQSVMNGNSEEALAVNRIWSTYNTAKVIRDSDKNELYTQGEARISIQMMKNEKEGGQLVVTAAEDIDDWSLTTADLMDGNGNTIPKADIAVYQQKYHELTSKRSTENPAYSIGDYVPDMLLPLEIAAEYGENLIPAGKNQGITVEVKTTSDTVPGIYRGNFELILDEEKYSIPVTVEVWDIEYTGKRTMQSSFLIYQNQILSGEYDNSEEVMRAYSDFLSEYKANALIWTGDTAAADIDAWMDEQKRLFENDNYNSIYIPYYFTTSYTAYGADGNLSAEALRAFEHFDAIVGASMEKGEDGEYIDYVDYAYMYVIHLDEADIDSAKKSAAEKVFEEIGKTYDAYLEKLQSDETFLALQASDPEYAAELLEAVGNISMIFVNVDYINEWVGSVDATFCTYLSTFREGYIIERYEEAAKQNSDGDLWAYIANMSLYPTPSFLTDDYNLGMRIAGWMEKAYGIDGFLYWNAAYYRVNGDAETWLDVYEDLDRASYVSGDGFLLYPGRYYGSESPFASLRLMTYRDSMDDYDMLCVYENLLKEHAAEYGIEEIDFNSYVEDLYWSLFEGVNYNTSDEALFAARRELATRILALQNEDKVLIASEKKRTGTTVKIYSQSPEITVDGKQQSCTACENGYVCTVTLDAQAHDLEIEIGENTYTYRVTGIAGTVVVSEETLSCADGSSAEAADGKASVIIRSVYRGEDGVIDGATLRYRPYVSIACDGADAASDLYFTIKNTGSEGFDARAEVVVNGIAYEIDSFYCASGAERQVKLHIFDSLGIDASEIKAVRISFQNVYTDSSGTQEMFADRVFELSDIFFDKR